MHPTKCENGDCTFIFKWSDDGEKTNFEINGKITNGVSVDAAWVAIGFSKDRIMVMIHFIFFILDRIFKLIFNSFYLIQKGDDCVVMCKHVASEGKSSIEHYYNVEEARPNVLDPNNPTVGLSDPSVITNDGFLTCKFTRLKRNDTLNHYFDLHNKFYILGAYGGIDSG